MTDNIGIMDQAYFVSASDLLRWLNTFFRADYTRIEQICSGSILCQVLDSIFENVPLQKVNFNAKYHYEYIKNFNVLVDVLNEHKIEKRVDIDRLVHGRPLETLEFLQWMKHLWGVRYKGQPYDAVQRREQASRRHVKLYKLRSARLAKALKADRKLSTHSDRKECDHSSASSSSEGKVYESRLKALAEKVERVRKERDAMECERDFYYTKLRQLEILCEHNAAANTQVETSTILDILWAYEEVSETGAVSPPGKGK